MTAEQGFDVPGRCFSGYQELDVPFLSECLFLGGSGL